MKVLGMALVIGAVMSSSAFAEGFSVTGTDTSGVPNENSGFTATGEMEKTGTQVTIDREAGTLTKVDSYNQTYSKTTKGGVITKDVTTTVTSEKSIGPSQ